ncbi:hypothetical protein JL720_11176 [Aureococcus anophagefferens]|nr:hypothetical protein JL720_11176 [Aureococcus anophagefferens]
MAEIEGLVRALREGDGAAKAAAARALRDLAGRAVSWLRPTPLITIAEAGAIPPLVELLRDGGAKAKAAAARTLGDLACNDACEVLIAEAGGIPPLVALLRARSKKAKDEAAWALRNLARHAAGKLLIAEAGGIPPLVKLLRDGSANARYWVERALSRLAHNNDANAVAIAAAVRFEALVQLARRGRVTVGYQFIVHDAGVPAKRKAALVVAALLRDYVPEFKSAPRDIKTVIASYL